jgi:hypothetical protein
MAAERRDGGRQIYLVRRHIPALNSAVGRNSCAVLVWNQSASKRFDSGCLGLKDLNDQNSSAAVGHNSDLHTCVDTWFRRRRERSHRYRAGARSG